MKNICLLSLIGLPSVGKSSFSQQFLSMETLSCSVLHLNYDEIILHGTLGDEQYKKQRSAIVNIIDSFIVSFKANAKLTTNILHKNILHYKANCKSEDLIIIADDNMYYRSMRYKLYQLCRKHAINYGQIYFDCDLNTALERNKLRAIKNRVPSEVILRMSQRLEPPLLENTWERHTFVTNAVNFNFSFHIGDILQFMHSLLLLPVDNVLESENIATNQIHSLVHELDLLLRKRISILLHNTESHAKRKRALELNTQRKIILHQFQLRKNIQDINLENYVQSLK